MYLCSVSHNLGQILIKLGTNIPYKAYSTRLLIKLNPIVFGYLFNKISKS